MGPADIARGLAADPPIRDRLIWRGLLNPAAQDLGDRAVVASSFGALYGLGGVIGLIGLPISASTIDRDGLWAAVCLGAIAIAAVCLIGYRHLPGGFFHFAAAAGVGLVTLAALAAANGSEPVFGPFYGFVVMLSMLFLRPLPATVQGGLAVTAYTLLLFGRDTPFAIQLLLSLIAMLLALGALIAVVRTRTSRIAGELSEDARVDSLTRIANRRRFDDRLELERERARRDRGRLALVICDLDHFKRVNDQLGHERGDEVLRRAARAIDSTTRTVELAARIGGEEFGLILPGADPEAAATAAERVRKRIELEFAESPIKQTISCGVASAEAEDADLERLFTAADRALYGAKRAGRNCTAIALGEDVELIGGGSTMGRLRQIL